jgi:hypothetical protein
MRFVGRARRLLLPFGLAGALAAGTASATATHASQFPQQILCSSGFVDGIVAGEHKCLHAGEFCSPGQGSDYEKYGFRCVSGRLQVGGAPPLTTTTVPATTPATYHPPLASKHAGCRARSALPDPACSPGGVFTGATAAAICVPGYSSSVRNVPESVKRAVYAAYGIRSHTAGQYEVDHLISLELGGSNAFANLWPEAALPQPGFHQKDVLENQLHARICSGAMSLATAQRLIARNWLAAYRQLHR